MFQIVSLVNQLPQDVEDMIETSGPASDMIIRFLKKSYLPVYHVIRIANSDIFPQYIVWYYR